MMALALELALKASVVMAASSVLVLLLRKRASAAWRHTVCLLAVTSLLALPLISAALPAWEIPIEVASAPVGTPSPNRSELSGPSAESSRAEASDLRMSAELSRAEARDLQNFRGLETQAELLG